MLSHHFTLSRSVLYCLVALFIGCSPQEPAPLEMPLAKPVPPINAPASLKRQLYGVKGSGVRKAGTAIDSIDVQQGFLVGFDRVTGTLLKGADFIGAQIPVRDRDGNLLMATITDWAVAEVPGLPQLERYILRTANGELVCGKSDDAAPFPNWAYPMDGVIDLDTGLPVNDPSAYTLACFGGAIAQCILDGYPPWLQRNEYAQSGSKYRDLDTYHAACILMRRADYCGDGTAHTYAGAAIDFTDALGFNVYNRPSAGDAITGPWSGEAEWTRGGAWCIDHTRLMPRDAMAQSDNNDAARNPHWQYILTHCPSRIAGVPDPNSGAIHPCGTQSTFLRDNGFDIADQTLRSVLTNRSPLYRD